MLRTVLVVPGQTVVFTDGKGYGYAEVLKVTPAESTAADRSDQVADLLTYGARRELYTNVVRGEGPNQWYPLADRASQDDEDSFEAYSTGGYVLQNADFTPDSESAFGGDSPVGGIAAAVGDPPTKAEFDALVTDHNRLFTMAEWMYEKLFYSGGSGANGYHHTQFDLAVLERRIELLKTQLRIVGHLPEPANPA